MPAQSCPTLCNPMGSSPPGSSVHGIFPARTLGWVAICSSRGPSKPRDWTCISCGVRRVTCIKNVIKPLLHHEVKWSEIHSIVSNSLWFRGLYSPLDSPGQNTGVGSLSLLQSIFPTQGLNPGLPHWRWILYQLSHKGSPWIHKTYTHTYTASLLITVKNWMQLRCAFSCDWKNKQTMISNFVLL